MFHNNKSQALLLLFVLIFLVIATSLENFGSTTSHYHFVKASSNNNKEEVTVTTSAVTDEEPNFDEASSSSIKHQEARYTAPSVPDHDVLFFDNFNEDPFGSGRWVKSKDEKYANQQVEWTGATGNVVSNAGDKGLLMKHAGQHYGVASRITPPIDNENKDLIVQYEVKFDSKLSCGGAYIKLLDDSKITTLEVLNNESPYIIMFGPDLCGANNKVHFILRHFNPKSNTWEEKHLKNAPAIKNDELSHLYTLIVRKDNTFEIKIDGETARKGSLFEEFDPSIVPPKEIDDPTDSKPKDWVDEEFMDDPEAKKPEDWDETLPEFIPDPEDKMPEDWLPNEPEYIPDPEARKPAEWDDDEDGKWEAPTIRNPKCEQHGCGKWEPRLIKNPNYKGKWVPPKVKNPLYKGPWSPRKIPNPNYFEDKQPSNLSQKIGAVFIEIWTMQQNTFFDNFLITHNENVAQEYASKTWKKKFEVEKEKKSKLVENTESSTSWSGITQQVIDKAQQLVKDYPIPVIAGTVVVVLLSTIPFCLLMRGDDEDKVSKITKTNVATKEEQKEKDNTETTESKEQEADDVTQDPNLRN
ncbi:hypothetical protein FDP41_013113 [Naegleria fowleri]|uniref:Calnexin n=1 Tax=Naegleria fowleri TaxID=5763 RepID=A0A6A5C445_NAEFO|nr:uncharacterized protein FDP41_013113 [Naegleria fowleri]KAF0980630.1 hypothetical protein FDP41_013113 [Naegleria fowleri]CAG4719454.1 unnamed protein product [Naegleria fowleri]